MTKGRKALPDAVKKLRGTDEKRRMRGEGMIVPKVVELDNIFETQSFLGLLSSRSKSIFLERCNQLLALRILTKQDLDQLSIYSDALDKFYICVEELAKGMFQEVYDDQGKVVRFVSNPYLKLYKDLVVIINRIGSDFGFSPVSRQKINAPEEIALDPLAELKKQLSYGRKKSK